MTARWILCLLVLGLIGPSPGVGEDREVVDWVLDIPGISGEERGGGAFQRGKLLLGEAVFSHGPREKLELMDRARACFLEAIGDRGSLSKEDAAMAEEFVRALEAAIASATGGKLALHVAVVGLVLEDEIEELDRDRFYEMSRKIYKTIPDRAKAAAEVRKARAACTRKHRARSKWTGRDDSQVKKALSEARTLIGKWSEDALTLELPRIVAKYPDPINMMSNRARRQSRQVLEPSRTWRRGVGPEVEQFLRDKLSPPVDLVMLVPKYETRKGTVRPPSALREAKATVVPALGRIPAAVVGLHSLEKKGKKKDGTGKDYTLGRRMAEAIYGALREGMTSLSADAGRVRSLLPAPRNSPDRLLERDVFFREAYGTRMSRPGLQLLLDVGRSLEQAQSLRVETGWPELSDHDLQTARLVAPGGSVELELDRKCRTRAFGLCLGRDRTDEKKRPLPLRIELETEEATYRFRYPGHADNLLPYRMELPQSVDVSRVRVKRDRGDAEDDLLVCEVVLFKP